MGLFDFVLMVDVSDFVNDSFDFLPCERGLGVIVTQYLRLQHNAGLSDV